MTTSETQPPIASHRECDCPPHVLRCGHFESGILFLTDGALFECRRGNAFGVTFGRLEPCRAHRSRHMEPTWTAGHRFYLGDSEADALEAFFAAERELLDAEVDAPAQLDAEAGR